MNETIYPDVIYTRGHRAVHNKVGDYEMICPTHGRVPGFIPYMLRSTQRTCRGCGQEIAVEASA